MSSYIRTHLKQLESEAIYVIREVAAQFERPVLLFSGGKDSIVLSHLAHRAFYPGRIPFPLMHIDTGHNFQEALDFRDDLARKLHVQLIVRYVQDSIDQGRAVEETGPNASRNGLQTITLLDALAELKFEAAMGGARRDEEKARAKERFFSHRDAFGQWDPKNQRPELWALYNGRKHPNEHFRVFPISNWTEMDIWQYVKLHNIELPSLYFAHQRDLVRREGMWLAISDVIKPMQQETVVRKLIRFRTVGDMTCTGAVESAASTLDEIIQEVASARVTERGRARMTNAQKPPWKIENDKGISELHERTQGEEKAMLTEQKLAQPNLNGQTAEPELGAQPNVHMASDAYLAMDMLRFTTAGSVDDGKSTLIGRLLYDSKAIFEDQLEAVERASRQRGDAYVDLALLTDGLRAEREQGITIDVAYRYFATPKRKFIIADTPGHIQYTRNMVTGASTAELAIILIDARKGVVTQSKRHGFIASLLQIPHILVAVNKMDLVDYEREVYERIVAEYTDFATKLSIQDLTFIPISALMGDNVVHKSDKMPWYDGPSLLHHLENVNVGASLNLVDFRFPVQTVIRPHQDYRGFAGQIASGSIMPGEEIVVLPAGKTSRVKAVITYEGEQPEAIAGDSITLTLDDEIDISRGDMIVRKNNLPQVDNQLECTICWMSEEPFNPSTSYVLQHTTRRVRAFVNELNYRIDVDTLHREETDTLRLNEIGRVKITTTQPLFFDSYRLNRATGNFILIDPATNTTVAAGMIRRRARTLEEVLPKQLERQKSSNVIWESSQITREMREQQNGHRAAVLWFTGLSGSGKSTVARQLERRLFELGCRSFYLDGDNVRHGLNGDLGFSDAARKENIRRVAEVAKLSFEHGNLTLCTFISPFAADRNFARSLLPAGRFVEVYVKCDIEVCKRRDPKGLYARAMRGEISEFTGVTSPYEEPQQPELIVETDLQSADELVERILAYLIRQGILAES